MISIIIPFFNESESLSPLLKRISSVFAVYKKEYEVILVNDGSTDAGETRVRKSSTITLLHHRKRSGKGKALLTGFHAAKGDVIMFMDADLQDDPDDIPHLLEKIDQGYDLVNGWRSRRLDPFGKTIPSFIFNTMLLKWFFKSRFHDINCGFKAMKRIVLDEIRLYGDNYRFLPIIAEQQGFKTTEIEVHHHPRRFGTSKYGFFRLLFGLMDTITIYFIYKFSEKPLHFFGPIGMISLFTGLGIMVYLTIERVFFNMLLYRRPLLTYGVLFILVGMQVVMTGIIAELIVYMHKTDHKHHA